MYMQVYNSDYSMPPDIISNLILASVVLQHGKRARIVGERPNKIILSTDYMD